MPLYSVPIVWQMCGRVVVNAPDEVTAEYLALESGFPEESEYVPDSTQIDDLEDVLLLTGKKASA